MPTDPAHDLDPALPATPVPYVWLPVTLNVGLHIGLWGIWCGWLSLFVPRYQNIFLDFGVSLPNLTISLIRVSEFVSATPLGVMVALLAAAAGDAAIDRVIIRSAQYRLRLLLGLFRLSLPALLLAISVASCEIPLLMLIRRVASRP